MITKIQDQFAQSILTQDDKDLLQQIPAANLTASQALQIYRDGYQSCLQDVLAQTYQAVVYYLTRQEFLQVANQYIQKYPSTFYNLSDYGEHFFEVLGQYKTLPFLPDLARFEWEFKELFHSADAQGGFGQVALNDSDSEVFLRFSKSSRLLSFSYLIYDLWRAKKDKKEIDYKQSQYLFLYKQKSEIVVVILKEPEYQVLTALSQGKNLSQTLDNVALVYQEFDQKRIYDFFLMLGGSNAVTIEVRSTK